MAGPQMAIEAGTGAAGLLGRQRLRVRGVPLKVLVWLVGHAAASGLSGDLDLEQAEQLLASWQRLKRSQPRPIGFQDDPEQTIDARIKSLSSLLPKR